MPLRIIIIRIWKIEFQFIHRIDINLLVVDSALPLIPILKWKQFYPQWYYRLDFPCIDKKRILASAIIVHHFPDRSNLSYSPLPQSHVCFTLSISSNPMRWIPVNGSVRKITKSFCGTLASAFSHQVVRIGKSEVLDIENIRDFWCRNIRRRSAKDRFDPHFNIILIIIIISVLCIYLKVNNMRV